MNLRNLLYPILYVSVFCFFISCSKQKPTSIDSQKPVNKDIESINVLFLNYKPDTNKTISPSDFVADIPDFTIQKNGILDASITDTSQINSIKKLLDTLQPSSVNGNQDSRIVVRIKHKDKTTSLLTLNGEYADQIFLDNIKQESNNELVFIIKNYMGYYPWFIGDELAMMPELRDNSFPKSPFYRSSYYKQYQETLSSQ